MRNYTYTLILMAKISFFLVCVLALFQLSLLIFPTAKAQTDIQFIPFWRAESYAPPSYAGKVLPTEKTNVMASFELLQSGRFIDLKGKRVVWLFNGDLLKDGVNIKNVTFKNYAYGSSGMNFDVRVFGLGNQVLSYSFTIPTSPPRLVIDSPYEKNNLAEKTLNLVASPYFFNVSDSSRLNFSWMVNGVAPPEGSVSDPSKISISIPEGTPSGTKIDVKAEAKNPVESLESATAEIIYQTKL